MGFAEFDRYDGLGLGELVQRGEVSSRELVQEVLERIERVQGPLNAVVHTMGERALAEAERTPRTGPFAGVPLLVKDLVSPLAGEPMRKGCKFFEGYIPTEDSEFLTRLRRAGFVLTAKTATPEFGILPVTEPQSHGATRNPWSTDHTTGGSSGGSAAVVAAGVVPIATGGDGGGSIRIPASCCGVFGLKPTRGRTPTGPSEGELWQGCAGEHVLTRSVRDSAAVLDAVVGADPGEPYVAPPPARSYLQALAQAPRKLRIGFTTEGIMPAVIHADCQAAVRDAAKLCADLGHEVVEEKPAFDAEAFSHAFLMMLCGEVAAEVAESERLLGRKARSAELEPGTWLLTLLGRRYTAVDFALADHVLKRSGRQFVPYFARYDVLLTPTLGKPPLQVGELLPKGAELAMLKALIGLRAGGILRSMGAMQKIAADAWSFTPSTAPFNATGQPAMSVPLYWNTEGLPIGTQFVGRFGDEETLLQLAAQLEAARPWRQRRPPVWSGK